MMDTVSCSLTVLFEDPFWIGVYERVDGGLYEAARIVFGAESIGSLQEGSSPGGTVLFGSTGANVSIASSGADAP